MAHGVIVGRRTVAGWRNNKDDPRNIALKQAQGTLQAEGGGDEGDDNPQRSASLQRKITWLQTQGGTLTLDRVKAVQVIESKMRTFKESNRVLYEEFADELKKLIRGEKSDILPEFTIVASGSVLENGRTERFIQVEHNGKKYVLPEGFRTLCRFAISRRRRPDSRRFRFGSELYD